MQLIAAIDIGTNSTRLLVVQKTGAGWKELARKLAGTRLGEGIRRGVLPPSAMERTAEAVGLFYREALSLGAQRVVAAATSAVRDASNRAEFLSLVKLKAGLPVRVLSGEEEARLSYRGVISGLDIEPDSTVVVDVGGGSTELIWMQAGRLHLVSVKAGAVRLTGAGGRCGPAATLGPALVQVKRSKAGNLVGVGGTVTTLAAIDQKLVEYDPRLVHGYTLTAGRIKEILSMLSSLDLADRRRVPGLQPERADIILAGVEIVLAVMEGLAVNRLVVSESDILMGLIQEEVERK
ncbi:MAG: Ppx/GppA family phosphatase [Pelotomaculaceae bacterium]|jgi:exopolyphosphatase/guanosine-5'-triphosphate,3'-diphosphate pyrophosphatase|uniref:Guanosine-5'-triphosphate,3'-diphosphate pyrophosphatase n=1 Tax=anaerobic digester metagenome TaxID=1263854 RepID=A0A485MDW0_9ZZZZ|nr:Ppx/GppA phosphatase family protein [Bacillota bacterium]